MLVTIATPTYNRAHLLRRLYNSLCKQTSLAFEWIVVDDGSKDGTECLVNAFIEEGLIQIRYIQKPNGGKHTAVNLAVREAKGELIFIADSDDWLPETAIEDVSSEFEKIKDNKKIAGVCGLDAYEDGRIVGSGFHQDYIDASPQEIRSRWNVSGDLKEVFRTEVLRAFPFPEIKNEKFCPEALVWNRIGQRYNLRYFNKAVYTIEYQADGITSSITRARMESPIATMMTYSELFSQSDSFKDKLRSSINYWRFAFCSRRKNRISIAGWGNLLFPFGWFFHMKDLYHSKRLQ